MLYKGNVLLSELLHCLIQNGDYGAISMYLDIDDILNVI